MRLDKYISNSGVATRSEVKKLLKGGLITLDGNVVKNGDIKIDESASVVLLKGERIVYNKYIYLMLNKPKDYVSATEDKHYKVVTELVKDEHKHYNVSPVGRLDIDTEGLLILTNDGQFNHNVTAPKKDIYKRYFARVDKPMIEADIIEFQKGMEFKDFVSKPAKLEITNNPCEVYIEIAEGKFHQVKRMCERVGKSVTYLKRVSIGKLVLDETLSLGEMREMSKEELELIFK